MPYWSLPVLSIPLYPWSNELFLSFPSILASPVPLSGFGLFIVPLWGCNISTHFINFKYEHEHEYGGYGVDGGGCGGCGWCVYSPTCLLWSTPTAPKPVKNLWKNLRKNLWKNVLVDSYLSAVSSGSAMWNWLFEWVPHVQKPEYNGPWKRPRKRRRRRFVLSFSVMTCYRHDCLYVYDVMAAVAAVASCFCCCR